MSVKTEIPPNAERGPPFLFLYTVELGQKCVYDYVL